MNFPAAVTLRGEAEMRSASAGCSTSASHALPRRSSACCCHDSTSLPSRAPAGVASPAGCAVRGVTRWDAKPEGVVVGHHGTRVSAWRSERRRGTVVARLENKDSDHSRADSASLLPAGSSVKLNRLDSTLPLTATASGFKASVRAFYSLAMHGGLCGFGCLICHLAGTNIWEMIHLEPLDVVKGSLLAVPLVLLGSLLQLENLVQSWEVARGIRDAEDEELVEYYLGMSPVQYIPVAVASAVSQEVFFRAALQGCLALAFHLGGTASLEGNLLHHLGTTSEVGMAAVSGYFPAFAPFSQLHAAVVMAAVSGSFDYATSLRSVPNVIVTDGRNLQALKATFGEWYQRQQLKSIYAPMYTGMLAFYFGLEWILVGNLLAPIVSHSLYLMWSMQYGLARLDRTR